MTPAREGRPGAGSATTDIGPYRLATRIAVGGMAEVFRALRRQTAGADRAVVIKRMLPSLAADPEGRAMFEHEADLGLRVRHRNVVELLDHDVDGDAPYLVLEYVFGVDLRRLLRWLARSGRRLPVPLASWLATEILAGLHAVHTARDEAGSPLRIVHRDVSPSNVFLSVHGDVKLGDLGIARALLAAGRVLGPRAAAAKGKLGYLAPEQVDGAQGDARSDVFAAGAIAAEMLLGAPLFSGGSDLGVLLAIRDARIEPLLRRTLELPDGLVAALVPSLARSPDQRTQDADKLRRALLPFVSEAESDLRGDLGGLVVGALDAADDDVDRTSLAQTVEGSADALLATAAARSAGALDRAKLFDVESPGGSVGPKYEVRTGDKVLGPWPYSRVVQALRTAEIDRTSLVSVGGATPRPLAELPQLARHLPPKTDAPAPRPQTPVAPRLAETSESWDLARGGLVPVLLRALADRETGLLLCEHSVTRKEIHLDEGVPTFVTSNRLDEMLGERLVSAGVVDRVELNVALAVMPRFEGRLGDTLVALGLVDPLVLFGHIASQVREKLLDVFTWTAGRAALYRHVESPERSFPLHLDPWELLEAGMRRRIDAGLEPTAEDVRRVLVRDPRWEQRELELPDHLEAILEIADIPRSLREIESTLAQRGRARGAALLLVEIGALRWAA